jgi:hypothetical protein
MSPITRENALRVEDDEPTIRPLDSTQSRIFRGLLDLAISAAASPIREFLQGIRTQVGDGPSEVTLSAADFLKMLDRIKPQVTALPNLSDQNIANAFLDTWDPRGGGTTVIVTQ